MKNTVLSTVAIPFTTKPDNTMKIQRQLRESFSFLKGSFLSYARTILEGVIVFGLAEIVVYLVIHFMPLPFSIPSFVEWVFYGAVFLIAVLYCLVMPPLASINKSLIEDYNDPQNL